MRKNVPIRVGQIYTAEIVTRRIRREVTQVEVIEQIEDTDRYRTIDLATGRQRIVNRSDMYVESAYVGSHCRVNVGDALARWRTDVLRESQRKLAARIHVAKRTIQRIESRNCTPTPIVVAAVCRLSDDLGLPAPTGWRERIERHGTKN